MAMKKSVVPMKKTVKKTIKTNVKSTAKKRNSLEDSYNAKGMAFQSGQGRSPSPSASTRTATATKRFEKEAMKDKKTSSLYGKMSKAQREAFLTYNNKTS
tara:strand:+ start:41 stop:340 length:300 start_codon:yes stop_codon:yes gene_type:complete